MINGVILNKLQSLDEVLAELQSLGVVTTDQLDADWRTRRAVERDLQVLVEIMIDICQRFLSLADRTPAATATEAMQRCVEMGVLSDYANYRRMVQFRNFIVHRYERIDLSILVEIVNRHLKDFERFKKEVLDYVRSRELGAAEERPCIDP
jgi:uncharacterized protein YutE (UPF0331/DUF86 family)